MSKLTISIGRTVQVQQYEPLTLHLNEEIEIPEDLDRKGQDIFKLNQVKRLGKVLELAMERELDRYRK